MDVFYEQQGEGHKCEPHINSHAGMIRTQVGAQNQQRSRLILLEHFYTRWFIPPV
jgi:hypothetical protein